VSESVLPGKSTTGVSMKVQGFCLYSCGILAGATLAMACDGEPERAQPRVPDSAQQADERQRAPDASLPRINASDPEARGLDENDAGALACPHGGKVGGVLVEFECQIIRVHTCKDLSNVVLEFADGTRQRFEDLQGHSNVFSGTGANAAKQVVRVWVKAGANHSGDGPGYGERIEAPDQTCVPPSSGSGGAGGSCVVTPDGNCVPVGGVGGVAGDDAPCIVAPDNNCLPGGGIGGRSGATPADVPAPD
jgi:hypothetical protein